MDDLGMIPARLAEKSKLPKEKLSRILAGQETKSAHLIALADALECDPLWLFDGRNTATLTDTELAIANQHVPLIGRLSSGIKQTLTPDRYIPCAVDGSGLFAVIIDQVCDIPRNSIAICDDGAIASQDLLIAEDGGVWRVLTCAERGANILICYFNERETSINTNQPHYRLREIILPVDR